MDKTTVPVLAEALKSRFLVAAIDFGTTYSGYAFQYLADFKKNPLSVKPNEQDPTTRGLSRKFPSCILFDKDKQFHSFGEKAEETYNKAVSDGNHLDWYFFKRFKMVLYKEQAEIDTAYLSLSLEPEAASLFCRYLPVEKVAGADRAEIRSLKAGDRYMIIDAGGGTVDITIHEILEDSTLKEFAKANGGEWGGTKVDEKFEQLLNDVLGLDAMEVIKQHFRDDFLEMKQTFEFVKRNVTPDMSGPKKIRIPLSFIDKYKELNKVDLDKTTLIPAHLQKKVTFDKDKKMTLDADLLKGLYEEVCDKICAIADGFFQQIKQYNVDKILMVGGFSQSAMLQDKVRKTFPNCRVIIPEDADLAVLKGAVLFGHNPSMIVARVCKYSYGIRAMKHYEPGIDPKDKRVVQGDIILCKDFFSKHATVGQEFNTEAKVYTQEYVPSDATGTELEVWVYTSPNKHPIYIDEEGCRKLGEIRVKLQDIASERHSVKIQFEFGKTELQVKVVDMKTNLEVKTANFEIL